MTISSRIPVRDDVGSPRNLELTVGSRCGAQRRHRARTGPDDVLRSPSNTSNVLTHLQTPAGRCAADAGHSPRGRKGRAMTALDYRLVDFDNHYYEAEDAFTRYPSDRMASERYVRWLTESDGKRRRLFFGTQEADTVSNPTFHRVCAGVLSRGPHGADRSPDAACPSSCSRSAPPTVQRGRDSRPWTSRVSKGRVVPHAGGDGRRADGRRRRHAPRLLPRLQPLGGRRLGVRPLRTGSSPRPTSRCATWTAPCSGARVGARPWGTGDHHAARAGVRRWPAHPHFDPFSARVNEAGVLRDQYHVYDGASKRTGTCLPPLLGRAAGAIDARGPGRRGVGLWHRRPDHGDWLSALILHNLFGRFPNIRVGEHGDGVDVGHRCC